MQQTFKAIILFVFICVTVFVFPSCKKEQKRSLYDLSVRYEDGKIDGKLAYKFVNTYNATFNHVVFNLHANAYKEGAKYRPIFKNNEEKAYPSGVNYGEISVSKVSIDSSPAKYEIYGDDCQFLKVFFDELKKGEEIIIHIDFITKIPNSTLRLGENEKGINLADFFPVVSKIQDGKFLEINYSPVGDPFFADLHDYKVDVTVPSQYTVASSGFPTLTTVDGITTTYSYELSMGRDFAFLLSKDYNVSSKTVDGILFTYYGFSGEEEKLLDLAIDCVKYFSTTFGDFPYKSLSIAENKFILGGMEYSGLCFINCDTPTDDKKQIIVHEIAHQWWHSAVGNNQYASGYLDEGLCEYSTYLYFKNNNAKTNANDMVKSAKSGYKSFFSIEETLSGNVNTVMERELCTFKNEFEYTHIAYNKSLLAFVEYENLVGEKKAIENLAKLYKNNLYEEITLERLIKSLGYGEHFNAFAYGKVLI